MFPGKALQTVVAEPVRRVHGTLVNAQDPTPRQTWKCTQLEVRLPRAADVGRFHAGSNSPTGGPVSAWDCAVFLPQAVQVSAHAAVHALRAPRHSRRALATGTLLARVQRIVIAPFSNSTHRPRLLVLRLLVRSLRPPSALPFTSSSIASFQPDLGRDRGAARPRGPVPAAVPAACGHPHDVQHLRGVQGHGRLGAHQDHLPRDPHALPHAAAVPQQRDGAYFYFGGWTTSHRRPLTRPVRAPFPPPRPFPPAPFPPPAPISSSSPPRSSV